MRKFCPSAPSGATPVLGVFKPPSLRCRKLIRAPQEPKSPPPKERKPVLLFPSMKAGSVGARRYWYIDLFYLLDANPAVVSYTTDTRTVTFTCDGIERTHRPDVEADVGSRRVAISLLLESEAAHPDNAAAAALLSTFYAERGMEFRVITDTELKSPPRLENAKTLFRHRHLPMPSEMGLALATAIAQGPLPTLGAVHEALNGSGEALVALLSLVANGFIEVDLDVPLGASTPIVRILGNGRRA